MLLPALLRTVEELPLLLYELPDAFEGVLGAELELLLFPELPAAVVVSRFDVSTLCCRMGTSAFFFGAVYPSMSM